MSRKKKYLLISSAIICLVLSAFLVNFFATHSAESSLKSFVETQSNGKIQLDIKKINFAFSPVRFEIIQPELRTTDSITTTTGYQIKAKDVTVRVKSLFTYFLGKHLVVDSITVKAPEFEVYKYREEPGKKVTLKDEMSNVYKSLEKILDKLNLNYLHIDSAKFRIYEKSIPGKEPLQVTNLNLTINNFSAEKGLSRDRFLFSNRILLEVFDQEIPLADGYHGIKFKKLRLSTRSQTIKLDSCHIYGRHTDSLSADFNVFVDSLRISKLDFNLLVNKGTLKIDSAVSFNPVISSHLRINEKKNKGKEAAGDVADKDSAIVKIKKMLGNLDIGYMSIKNAHINIVTEKDNEYNVFNTQKTDLIIENIVVDSDSAAHIKVGRLFLDIQNYTGYSPDSLYLIRFDDIEILNNKILLTKFSLSPTQANHDLLKREITMKALEIDDINWFTLLYEKRIISGHVSLIKPELHLILSETNKGKSKNEKKNPFTLLADIQKKVQIGDLLIEDGSLYLEDLKGLNFFIKQLNSEINVNQLLQSSDEIEMIDAINTLSSGMATLNNSKLNIAIRAVNYSKRDRSLHFDQVIQLKSDKSMSATLGRVDIEGIKIRSGKDFSASSLTWGSGELSFAFGKESDIESKQVNSAGPRLLIGAISGGPTVLSIHGDKFEASTQVNSITTDEIILEGGNKPKVRGLAINGQRLNLHLDQFKNSMSDFYIQEKKTSTLNNVEIALPVNSEIISILVPRLLFSADIYESINGNFSLDFIELIKPVFSFSPNSGILPAKSKTAGGKFPKIRINNLKIEQPLITSLPPKVAMKMFIDPGRSSWNFKGINSDSSWVNVDSFSISLRQPEFKSNNIKLVTTGKELISLSGSDLKLTEGEEKKPGIWSVNIDSFRSSELLLNTLKADSVSQTIMISSFNLENIKLESDKITNPSELIRLNNFFKISDGNISVENGKTRLETFNLTVDKKTNSLSIDSIAFSPLTDRDSFMKTKQNQSNYIQLRTGTIKAQNIDFNLLAGDTVVNSEKVTINDLHFYDYKDKRLPFQHGIEKPLLTELIKKVKTSISIDTILLRNGLIEYEEFNPKTDQFGKIKLSKIRGRVLGVKNYDFLQTDSLTYNLYALFMDAADLRVSYAQSYTDTLSGSYLKVIASSFDLTKLNPLLIPFASAEVKRGYLDTIRMSAIFRKHIAFGTMRMYYHDLNVQYLKKGDEVNQTVLTKSVSLVANSMVRTKNQSGKGEVFAERDPEKGFVNYWLKIVIGGVFTNTGVRTDQKQEKKYNRSIKKYNVPPIPNIPVDY